jgi:hypothetical protein
MKCLCCDQEVNAPGLPLTIERATRAVHLLAAVGWTKEKLLADDRLDHQAPGLRALLEDGTVAWP